MDYKAIDFRQYFRQNDGHGNGLIILGKVRLGKTYLLGIIAKILLDDGFAVISNVRFTNEVFDAYRSRLFYMTDDISYFKDYLSIPVGVPIVVLWDDAQAQMGMSSTGVASKMGRLLSTFLTFIGKLESNYIYVAHRHYIPHSITAGFEPLFLYKLDRFHFWVGNRLYESNKEIRRYCHKVQIPTPNIMKPLDFQSKAIAVFQFKLDLEDMFYYCSRFDIQENLRKGIKEYLEKNQLMVEYIELKKLSYSDILLALMLKRKREISSGDKIKDLINDKQIDESRKKYRQITK